MKILLIVDQCNPEWSSVPLVGYNFYNEINKLADVTLVTHERNKLALEKVNKKDNIIYISESIKIQRYYRLTERLTPAKANINWPLKHALTYPIYAEFNRKVYHLFKNKVLNGNFDIVHSITPILPRYPVKIINACKQTPFILGPVNGGIPFPEGFSDIARKEFSYLNFLKLFTRLLPGLKKTYKNADRILAGSTYTLNSIKNMLSIEDNRISLFFENGISSDFYRFNGKKSNENPIFKLLFAGRLVPYKGANLVVDAVGRLKETGIKDISLTIVGDGPERENLKNQAVRLGISELVNFTGWVKQIETLHYYKNADLFCFPSIREFGGAVVLEAMACGLPCIVINYGGIGEYVAEKTGFKINPISNDYIVDELVSKINLLLINKSLRETMSQESIERAREFQWGNKAKSIVAIYQELINNRACN